MAKGTDIRHSDSIGLGAVPGAFALLLTLIFSACSEIERPKVEPFYAAAVPPRRQELRWSNGGFPKTLDPARAAAAPETDIVRALYEGLTELDSKTLKEMPGVAEKWEFSKDSRTWTFHLRRDARWSNGERVTAQDFVRSWKRLAELKDKAANGVLFKNIVGSRQKDGPAERPPAETGHPLHQPRPEIDLQGEPRHGEPKDVLRPQIETAESKAKSGSMPVDGKLAKNMGDAPKFGVEAIDDATLKVDLELPDKDFARLVANPIFRPVYGDGADLEEKSVDPGTITNGPFRLAKADTDGLTLERSETYWNRKAIILERVQFVPSASAEAGLEAYKKGELDVLTNAAFEPAALKLLAPYEDFRYAVHSALNYYEFNAAKPPFDDRRVREALAISIDREKLAAGDLEGATRPAFSFLPINTGNQAGLTLDIERSRDLLQKAGFPDGSGFPPIRLVVNRNDAQQRIARSIARMWKQQLNLDTEIVVKETAEIEDVKRSGEFDLLRRGVVLSANDELASLESILGSAKKEKAPLAKDEGANEKTADDGTSTGAKPARNVKSGPFDAVDETTTEPVEPMLAMTEADALYELKVIPLYFPVSYALVKPYVRGFEMNGLDAQSLKEISIDSGWQPRSGRTEP
jgi:oligopeptide transport system substrate-binding protein